MLLDVAIPLLASFGRWSDDGATDGEGATFPVALGAAVTCRVEVGVFCSNMGLTGRRAMDVLLLEAVALGQRVGGLEGRRRSTICDKVLVVALLVASSTEGRARGHGSAFGNARIGRSGATMWEIVSKVTTSRGGEHHTNRTRVDKEDGVLARAMARGLRRTEQRR